MSETRFDIRYSRFMRALAAAFRSGPSRSDVVVDDETVRVRFGSSFAADVARSAITSATHDHARVSGWGVHRSRGAEWLVNGSSHGIVRLSVDPPAAARLLGRRVTLRVLRVSLTDPEGFLACLDVKS